MLFRFIALAAFAFAGHAVVAQSADVWNSVDSQYFSIIGNASVANLQATAIRLEQFRWAFSHVYPNFKLDNDRKTKIVLFKDAASYFEFLPKRPDGSTDVGVAGYFQPGDDINYITFALSSERTDPLSTAVHEYFHSVLESNYDRAQLPPWVNEGLAEYFETVSIADQKNIVVGSQQIEHLRLLRRSTLIPMAEFFTVTSSDLKVMSPERRRLYYAEAWAVVHTLMQNDSLALGDLITSIARWSGKNGITPAEQAIMYTMLEQEMNRAIRGSFLTPQSVTQADNIPAFRPPTAELVGSAAVWTTLGDLLQHTGELGRSETFLRRAVAAQPDDAQANGAFGVLLVRQEKPDDAKPYLQRAVAAGNKTPLVLFNCAYATLHDYMSGSSIDGIPDEAAQTVRILLQGAISAGPLFSESYRLLALVDFVRDEQLDDAVGLLQKGLTIKKDDAEMQLLLARILLRREDVTRAGQIAERIASTTSDTKRKAEADEIVKAVYDYNAAKSTAAMPVRLNITVGERQGLVVLKRSWLTDDDIAAIDRERENNNYNRLIIRPVTGEVQVLGHIEKITCAGNSIAYRVKTADTVLSLSSGDFNGVRMTVAREGNNTFQIGCEADLSKELAAINYRPRTANNPAKSQGEVTAISFVAEDFHLKSISEMFAARLVAIDDDTLRRSGPKPAITPESIRRSIEQHLRRLAKNEERIAGTIQSIRCSTTEVDFLVVSGGKTYIFASGVPSRVDMGWFTVASSQLPFTCGSGPVASNTIITFVRNTNFTNANGELKSIEFVPDGLVP